MIPLSRQVFVIFVSLVVLCNQVSGYKILVVVGIPSRSHYNLGKGIADILHERKHEITFAAPYGSKAPAYREIVASELRDFDMDVPSFSFQKSTGFIFKMNFMIEVNNKLAQTAHALIHSTEIQEMLQNKTEKFDLVIAEYFSNEAIIGFGVKFNCPVVLISPMSMPGSIATLTGNPVSPGTVPNVFLPYSNSMNLWQRTVNTLMCILQDFMGWWQKDPSQKIIYEEFFPEEAKKVPYEKLGEKVAAVLINSHPSLNIARPLLPNAIEVGGYHIEQSKPLPQDLQELLDSKKEGVIYFSMGSILKSSVMPKDVQVQILKSFSKLKQTVLWKFEEDLVDKPKNVIIKSWMPQSAILAHPNVKIFISHGGLLSCTEAIHHGVPLLAIPIFGDQSHNAAAVVERGHGLTVDYLNLTETSLTWALDEMLNNPKYEENAMRIYKQYHDRPMKPRDLVIFYAEHAIRSGGAPHLSPAKLSRSSDLLLDVFLVLLLPPFLLLVIATMICRKIVCSKKINDNKKTVDQKKKMK